MRKTWKFMLRSQSERWTRNDLLLHMYSSFYSCWGIVGVVKSSTRTHWRNETNESTLWEIMMSSSISIHIPFIAKIIDFLVLFSPHTHRQRESGKMFISTRWKIFRRKFWICVSLSTNEALNIYGWRCVLIFSNEAMTSIVPFSAVSRRE